MALSKRLRFEILRRDNHACRYCGAAAPDAKLTVDHVVPQVLGGTDDPGNLVAACVDCNAGKSSINADEPLVADVQADALRWSRAMQFATERAQGNLGLARGRREAFEADIWNTWKYESNGKKFPLPLPLGWEDSVDRFWEAGIGDDDFEEAVRKAMTAKSRDPFKYMCGILWRWITERQAIAMEILGDESDTDH